MDKIKAFEKEIGYIKSPKYKENIKILIDLLPDYFFEVAASSTGKYHPKYAQGEGGLLRHTKVAVRIGYELLNNEIIGGKFQSEEKDMILMALLLHDGLKHGIPKEQYVRADHPLLIANYIKEHKRKLTLTDNEVNALTNMIETHMGQYNTDYRGNVIMEKPSNRYQKFVHMCDALASKKFLEVPFDGNEILY